MRDVSWADSAGKHGIARSDVLWVLNHPVVFRPVPDRIYGDEAMLILGYTQGQPMQWLEIVIRIDPVRQTVTIFHAMKMRSKWQFLLDEQKRRT